MTPQGPTVVGRWHLKANLIPPGWYMKHPLLFVSFIRRKKLAMAGLGQRGLLKLFTYFYGQRKEETPEQQTECIDGFAGA